MAKKVSAMTELAAGATAAGDWMVVEDLTAGTARKIALSNVLDAVTTDFSKSWMDDANAAAVMTTLGIDSFAQDWLDDADLDAFLTTVGLDVDLADLSIPANTTITSAGATLAAIADAATARDTLVVSDGWTWGSVATANDSSDSLELITGLSDENRVIKVLVNNIVCTNTSDHLVIQLGDEDGYDIAGYATQVIRLYGAVGDETTATSGFSCSRAGSTSGGTSRGGVGILHNMGGTDRWLCSYHGSRPATVNRLIMSVGHINMGKALTKIRLNITGGANIVSGTARVKYREN
jgi:hypothetical protein